MAAKKIPPKKKVSAPKNKSAKRTPIELQRILVPIDFSEHSKNALKYAIPFAKQFKASIDLIYVVEPTIYPADFSFGQVGFPNVEEELRVHGNEELEQLIRRKLAVSKIPQGRSHWKTVL